jgi:glycosyltransferase involved in cell wall biosynthesis
MRKVLIIAYYFPPMGMAGVQRTLKFVKYLPDHNWIPTVLTISPGGYYAKDYLLLKEIENKNVNIVRAESRFEPTQIMKSKDTIRMPRESVRKFISLLSQTIFVPDNKIGWKKKALYIAEELMEKENFDVVYATAPPYTDLLIGLELKRKFHVPLVLDYRDAWVDNPYNFYPTPVHKLLNVKLEKKTLRISDHVITINRRIKELILRRYKFLRYSDVSIIPQGFDPEDFIVTSQETLPKVNKFRITYSGTFIDKRKPKYFLHALHKLLKEKPEIRQDIEACFVGNFRKENERIIKKLNLQDTVNIVGYVDHKECVKYLITSDILWLIIGKGKGEDMMSTGKLFEYIGARKPILGCVPDGIAKNIILESKAGIITEPYDIDGISKAIYDLYLKYKNNNLSIPSIDFVEKYNRFKLTEDLSKIFELLIDYSTFQKR